MAAEPRLTVILEDVMESLLGEEIVDESDSVVDVQAEARRQGKVRLDETRSSGRPDGSTRTG